MTKLSKVQQEVAAASKEMLGSCRCRAVKPRKSEKGPAYTNQLVLCTVVLKVAGARVYAI